MGHLNVRERGGKETAYSILRERYMKSLIYDRIFGNGRYARHVLKKAMMNQAMSSLQMEYDIIAGDCLWR